MKNLVLVGGGYAHIAVLKNFGLSKIQDVAVTLINGERKAAYSHMLPGLVAGHHTLEDSYVDLKSISRFANAQFVEDDVIGIDPDTRLVHLNETAPIAFDFCSINSSENAPMHMVPGMTDGPIALKSLFEFLSVYNALLDGLSGRHDPLRIGFVGGDTASIELMLAMQFAISKRLADLHKPSNFVEFFLFEQSGQILPRHSPSLRLIFRTIFEQRGITLYENTPIVEAGLRQVQTDQGELMSVDHVFMVAEVFPPDWAKKCSLYKDDYGFFAVDDTLQSLSHACVFASGGNTSVLTQSGGNRIVMTMQQGQILARNIRRILEDHELIPFSPKPTQFSVISTGTKSAVGNWRNVAIQGYPFWLWAELLNRHFIRSHRF